MKKTIAMLLAVAMCLSLSACGTSGNEPDKTPAGSITEEQVPDDSLKLGKTYEVEGYGELTLVRVATTDKIEGTLGGDIYYENNDKVKTFVDVVFDVTNTSGKVISSEEFMKAIAVSEGGTEYADTLYCVETRDMTAVEKYEDLLPDQTARFHAAITIPTSKTGLTLNFAVQDTVFSHDYEVGTEVKNVTGLVVGDTIGGAEYATAEFMGYEFTDKVNPSETSGYYRYYQVENPDNTYLAMKFKITNHQTMEKGIDTFISGKAAFEGNAKYAGVIISESADGQSLSEGGTIEPDGSAIVYCLIEVPKTVSEQDFTASIMFNAQEYAFGK